MPSDEDKIKERKRTCTCDMFAKFGRHSRSCDMVKLRMEDTISKKKSNNDEDELIELRGD
jgi:hypothetical protein